GGDVEDRPVVGGPRRAAPGDVVHDIGQFDPGVEVAYAQRVLLAAVEVGAPRQQVLGVADVEVVDREDVASLGLVFIVEQYLRRGVLFGSATAVDGVVAARFGARGVPPL